MMRSYVGLLGIGLVVAGATAVQAVYEPVSPEDRGQVLNGSLRTRAEYDDNVFTDSSDEIDSFKLLIEPEVRLNYPVNTSHLFAGYRFSYIWFDDRPMDDSDINHDLNVAVSSFVTPRLSVDVTDLFRVAQDPELDPENVSRLRKEDFLYNSTSLGANYALTETLTMAVNGRYYFMDYEEDEMADAYDRDVWVVGADLVKEVNPKTDGVISYRYQDVNYDVTEKDSTSHFVFGGIDHKFNSQLFAHLRGGFENREFDNELRDDDNAPYVDVSAEYNLSARTRFSGGYQLSLSETDIGQFLKSERHGFYAKWNQTLSARLGLNVTAAYDMNGYDTEDSALGVDGDEDWLRINARLSYAITQMVSAEAGYMFTDLSSDFGRDYDRNRYYLGMRVTY